MTRSKVEVALIGACEQAVREIERLYTGQPDEALRENATYQRLLAALKTAGRRYYKGTIWHRSDEEPMDRT